MKRTKYEWKKSSELETEEERKVFWEEILYRKHVNKVEKITSVTKVVLFVMIQVIFNFLYTSYLTYYIPFFDIKLKGLKFFLDISFLKPVARAVKNIMGTMPLDEPISSVAGFLIFSFIIPILLTFALTAIMSKLCFEKVRQTDEALAGNEKEQLKKILDNERIFDERCGILDEDVLSVIFTVVAVINTVFFVSGRFFSGSGQIFSDRPWLIGIFLSLFIIAGFFLANLILSLPVMLIFSVSHKENKNISETFKNAKRRIENIDKKTKLNNIDKQYKKQFDGAVKLLTEEEYEKAEKEFSSLLNSYSKKTQRILRLYDELNATESREYEERDRLTEEIENCEAALNFLRKYTSDFEVGKAIAKHKGLSTYYDADIAETLGFIDKNKKDMKSKKLKAISQEITDEFYASLIKRAENEYICAMKNLQKEEWGQVALDLFIPAKMNYRDAEPIKAIANFMAYNETGRYQEILSALVATKNKIESDELKKKADEIINYILEYKRERRELDRAAMINELVVDSLYQKMSHNTGSKSLTANETDYMDWVMKKNREIKDYEKKLKNGEEAFNPIGDSDFPKDVEVFPDSSEVW